MTHSNNRARNAPAGRLAVCLVSLSIGLVFGVATHAQTPESRTAPEPIERQLEKLRKVISNAKVKLKNGARAFARPGDTVDASPAWVCCSANLKRIEKSAVAIQNMLMQLDGCYESAGETDSLIAVRLAQSDLQAMARAVQAFADAPTAAVAENATGAVARTFLNLADSAAELPECGDLIDPTLLETSESGAEPEDGGGQPREF